MPIPQPRIVQTLPLTMSIWDLVVFAVISTMPPFELYAPTASSSLRGRVSENYLKRIISTFYDNVQDCMEEILRDSLIPLKPICDILASSYTSISCMEEHEVVVPSKKFVKSFKRSTGAWRSLHTEPLTHLVDIFKEYLMQEFHHQLWRLIQKSDLVTKSLEDAQRTYQLADREVRVNDLEISNPNQKITDL